MLGKKLKNIRENLHISQRELGRRIGKTGQYISYLESSDNINPSYDVLTKIAEVLKVSLSDLISVEEESFSYNLVIAIEKITYEKTSNSGNSVINDIEYRLTQLDINAEPLYELIKYKNIELAEESQLILLKYLFELDYDSFFSFCENNKLHIANNPALNKFVIECYSNKIDDLKTTSFLSFKKYLITTFGNEIKDLNENDLLVLQEEVYKYLEFALFKLQKIAYGEETDNQK